MKVCSYCRRCYDDTVVSCADESHPHPCETRGGSPEMISGYRLESALGSSDRSETYRARHTASGQTCLIRIVSSDERDRELFLRDAKLAAALFHPNVADVYEAGTLDGGRVFAASEIPEGQTLREFLNTVGVPQLLTSILVVRQAAEALHALHGQGLIHRAVNPENIVLTNDPENRLLVRIQDPDLGGVGERSVISNKFLIDSAIPALRYFSPEQCASGESGPKTDVYSLGVVFYEMLAGVPPFDAPSARELIEKHKHQPPPDVRIENFNLRMLVTHTLMEALQKQPGLRTASANAFARQLRHIEQLATHVSTPPPAGVVPPVSARSAAAVLFPGKPSEPLTVQPAAAITPIVRSGNTVVTAGVESEQAAISGVGNELVNDLKVESRPVETDVRPEPVDTPFNVYEPASGPRVEDDPAIAFDCKIETTAPLDAEGESVRRVEAESFPVSPAAAERSDPDFPQIAETMDPEPEVSFKADASSTEIPAPRRSRLKARRRSHLRFVSSAEKPESTHLPAAEPEIAIADNATAEIPFVGKEPENYEAAPAHREPTRVEWETPEDDIPSVADVMEALLQEQMQQQAEAASKGFSHEEEVLLHEDVSAVQPAAVVETPNELLEDSSLPGFAAVGSEREVVELESERVSAVSECARLRDLDNEIESSPVTFRAESGRFPDVDRENGSADLLEVPALRLGDREIEELVAEIRPAPRKKANPTAAAAPKLSPVTVAAATATTPPVVAAGAAKSRSVPAAGKAVEIRREASERKLPGGTGLPRTRKKEHVPEVPSVQTEADEITAVTARTRRIRIEWENPAAPQEFLSGRRFASGSSADPGFYPTILGDAERSQMIDPDRTDPIFSAYYPLPRPGINLRFRSLAVGGGLLALVAVFLFGRDSITLYFETGNLGDSAAAKSMPAQASMPQLPQRNSIQPPRQAYPRDFERASAPNGDAGVKRSEAPTFDKRDLPDTVKSRDSRVSGKPAGPTPKTGTINRSDRKLPPSASPLATSPDSRRTRSMFASKERVTDSKPASVPNRTPGLTRPRIVKNPRP